MEQKLKIMCYSHTLDPLSDYTIEELTTIANRIQLELDYKIWEYRISCELEYNYGDFEAIMLIQFYREETDEECRKRISQEELQRLKDKERADKAKLKKEKKIQEKEKFNKRLNADPKYQEYLLLKQQYSYLNLTKKK